MAANLRGPLLHPGDARFDVLGLPLNQRFAGVRPSGVAVCATPEDVAHALTWSRDNGVPCVPRSGGHSFMGYSTNEGLVISTSHLNSVRYQAQSERIVVGGGASNKDVAEALKPFDVMFPAGQCPTVGVAGLTLGGGLGFSMRSLGMTSDQLISSQVVLADGEIVTASVAENPDLFWALRGGTGGNFGVNTEFTFAAHPARRCTHFAVDFPAARMAPMLDAWFTMLADAPRELGIMWYTDTLDGQPVCGTWGLMYGSESDTRDVLASLSRSAGPPLFEEYVEGTYWDAIDYLADGSAAPHSYVERSRFLDRPLSSDGIATLVMQLGKRPHSGLAATIFGWGGAIMDTPPDATAFVHRSPVALIKYGATWDPGDDNAADSSTRWVDEMFDAMEPHSSRRSFQNFPDGELRDWAPAYFGDNLAQLIDVKRKYDPDRRFDFAQAIPSR